MRARQPLRFVDLRDAYGVPRGGDLQPFAFLDTASGTFLALNGKQVFEDHDDLVEHVAPAPGDLPNSILDRLLSLVPPNWPH